MTALSAPLPVGFTRALSTGRRCIGMWRLRRRDLVGPVVLAAAWFAASAATATLINVDFNSSGPGVSVGTFSGTGVLGGGTWNGVAVNQSAQALPFTSLLDATGGASGVSIAIPAYQGAWNLASQPVSPWKPLMGDYLYVNAAGQSSATISLSGLGSSTVWNIVLYAADGGGEGSEFTIGGTTLQTSDSGAIGTTLTAGDEYVAFNNVVSDGSGVIAIAWTNDGTSSVLNGLQIQAVPEPSAAVAIAVAAVAGGLAHCRGRPRAVRRGPAACGRSRTGRGA